MLYMYYTTFCNYFKSFLLKIYLLIIIYLDDKMCTAISINKYKHYFGRTLDLEYNYNENVIIVPRAYNLKFRYNQSNNNHFAFIGIGIIENNYPLFYDGCNEKGL